MGKNVAIIAAMDECRGIGKDNSLPWKLREDLEHFKTTTWGAPVIMGRKTLQSLKKPLPGRPNIIVTRDRTFKSDGVTVAHSLSDACSAAGRVTDGMVYIIGGAEIFLQALSIADQIILTKLHAKFDCDCFFPEFDLNGWEIAKQADNCGVESGIRFSILNYVRTGTKL